MPRPTTRAQVVGLVLWLGAALGTGVVGAIASIDAAKFYATLAQPSWAPPAGVFGPVWSVLYVLMGVAAWLVWRERDAKARLPALSIFIVQLVLNALWSWLFFAWHRGAAAFVDVVGLLVLIADMVFLFGRVRRLAAWMVVPYLAWVGFASALTYAVWQRNPGTLG